ncbi:hypothetical protein K402DRAFT_388992 [Aulographum hederae CBS 113979]|uniref:CENP-V/GFA domain-containing protein n=1 Tax=Aulographum hederae CBS 113979 TaxID=1176131 RepID=A0A6G1HEZ1_9PEZI|nr:hypothetical protein K402DRAFT_388992 [Aulographum hederae CBS 113979]
MATEQVYETYRGNCHCGAVVYSVKLPTLKTYTLNDCNCSICVKNGYLLAYPLRKDLEFIKGKDEMKSYFCASKTNPHRFCGECGGSIMVEFTPEFCQRLNRPDSVALNIRMLQDIDPQKLNLRQTDGKEGLDPPYTAP